MKKTAVVLMVVLLQMFFIQSAMADDEKMKDKPKDGKVWYFAALPAYYFLVEIPIHESSHALATGISPNYQASNFKPWPHYNADGRFFLGSVDIACIGKACDDKIGAGVIAMAPYITATTIFTASDLLLATKAVEPTSITGRALYFAGMVVPWWDFSSNATIWANKGSDADHIASNFQIPRWSVMATGIGVSAVGIWRLWSGYKRAFPAGSKRHANESNLVIVPTGGSGTIGASASMRF